MLLSAKNITKKYVEKPILDHQDLNIEEGTRTGLIGVNGSGKSTLLKILAGKEDFDGEILKSRDLKMQYLAQVPHFTKKTVREELQYRNSLNKEPAEDFRVRAAATRFELPYDDTPIDTLSGGMKRRLDLAAVLISDANLLLLDEPTNHLDNDMIEWLENELKKSKASIVMVTHDRYFLERICTQILELDHGQLYSHQGGYASYLENRAARQEQAKAGQQKLNNIYRHELEWVRAGVQARSTKSKSRLQRFEELRKQRKSLTEKKLNMETASARLGKKTLAWENLSFGYEKDSELFRDFTYQTKRTDRIGIVGPNGCGKSTFLNLIIGDLKPDTGTIEWGETVRTGYFRQNPEMEDLNVRVIDYIQGDETEEGSGNDPVRAANLLEQFLFDRDQFYMPLSKLSGGERRRLYLLKILMKAPNILVLDEPTNDLDLLTIEILEDYLDSFPGIVISVSHDRSFLDRVCDYLFVFQPDHTFRQYPGGYSELLLHREEEKKVQAEKKPDTRKKRPVFLTSAEKRELAQCEPKIERLQQEIEECVRQMDSQTDFRKIDELSRIMQEKESELEKTEERWMELEARREEEAEYYRS